MQRLHRLTELLKPTAQIRRSRKTSYAFVDPATMKPLNALAQLIPLSKEGITQENVKKVKILVLLRYRAKAVCATHKRDQACLQNIKPCEFD